MMIECAKSTKPIGVRGRGAAAFLFCPLPTNKKGSGKYSSSKVLYEKCLKCDHYRGAHRSMGIDLAYTNPYGNEERIGEKKIVLTDADAEKHINAHDKWVRDEEERSTKNKNLFTFLCEENMRE